MFLCESQSEKRTKEPDPVNSVFQRFLELVLLTLCL